MALLIKSITKTFYLMKNLKYILPIFTLCILGNSGLQAQTPNITDFVTTWKTTTADEAITIPTLGVGYNYTVNWGDGTAATTHSGTSTNADPVADAIHTYADAGDHEVRISGTFPAINNFANPSARST